jgi:hypothetical protein
MAKKKFYIGDFGPFFYDDEVVYDDPDGDFSGESRVAFRADGKIKVSGAPDEDDDVVRLQDLAGLGGYGVTGSFISKDGKIVVITNGIIVGLL